MQTKQRNTKLVNGKSSLSSRPEILLITSYPPRECGIATYSQDLRTALDSKFGDSFSLSVCAIESQHQQHQYPPEVKYILNTTSAVDYQQLQHTISLSRTISMVIIQHEFGLYPERQLFLEFLRGLTKPFVIVFHTVIPHPDDKLRGMVQQYIRASSSVVVMTEHASDVLEHDYDAIKHKIHVIPHGTHLVRHADKLLLKDKYELTGKKVLSTFGLLSSGKGIETTLEALPEVIETNPNVVFLVIGKTHPEIIASQGEVYRESLIAKVDELNLGRHVRFVNKYLTLSELLEFLELTDVYLFTSLDPHQTVSGTLAYAMSCGCPVISTPIPQTNELIDESTGIITDFQNSGQLASAIKLLVENEDLRVRLSANTLQRILPTAWENSAILHAQLFEKISRVFDHGTSANRNAMRQLQPIRLTYRLPKIKLDHLREMTTEVGIIQFSRLNQPDPESGYTLDDNARALIATCMYYQQTLDNSVLHDMHTYLRFIAFCQQPEGDFLNYVNCDERFCQKNQTTNLSDSNGRAIWALGYLISMERLLPEEYGALAFSVFSKAHRKIREASSPRSIAFAIKGLYYCNLDQPSIERSNTIQLLAERLVEAYRKESEHTWHWFEPYMTYANAVLPEALLCAWQDQGNSTYKRIAQESFDFLLSKTFTENELRVISNQGWFHKGKERNSYGEQPIDVAYTVIALSRFYSVFREERYHHQCSIAFEWFLGRNQLLQTIYNPVTGGCFDGLEETQVNLNQGAESTVSYLISRLTVGSERWLEDNLEVLNQIEAIGRG